MPSKLTPLADGSGFCVLIRFGTKQRRRFRITTSDRAQAETWAIALASIGATLCNAKIDPELCAKLLALAGRGETAGVQLTAAALTAGLRVRRGADSAPFTMRDLGKAWTSGELAKKYPDHVKQKSTADKDAERLRVLCKAIGDVPVTRFAVADAKRAMAALPKELSSTTRRQYAQIIRRLLALAVWPLELIPQNPLPRGFLPRVHPTKGRSWLYPSEDTQLLACTEVALERRVLYGFLAREGLRGGEALKLQWSDLDLTRGVVRLDENKTDDPRAWALGPGVAAALERLPRAESSLVFRVENENRLAEAFRADLRKAKIDRPELFEKSKSRMRIRVHDLRATFVTLSLANGRSETWVSDRTGHRSTLMIARYRRGARTAAELGLGELAPLVDAVVWRETPTANAGWYSDTNRPPRAKEPPKPL